MINNRVVCDYVFSFQFLNCISTTTLIELLNVAWVVESLAKESPFTKQRLPTTINQGFQTSKFQYELLLSKFYSDMEVWELPSSYYQANWK